MESLFDETAIMGMALRNRTVRSATWEGMCDRDGRPAAKLSNCYRELARGEVGLIITGYAYVRPEGKQLPGKMGMHDDSLAPAMRDLTKAAHECQGKICVQLVHAGGQTGTKAAGGKPLAPSAVAVAQYSEVPEEMTAEDINAVVEAFGLAAHRAREWGFDAVQLHAAHGYLINQFLSPLTNRRNDAYGGSLENRCRFLMETYREVRRQVGNDYPVMVKLNGSDNLEGGLGIDDAVSAARLLDAEGLDAIEVSGGTPASPPEMSPVRQKIKRPEHEAYNLALARSIKDAVRCPVMVVGGFRSYDVAQRTIREEGMDFISLARPLIREPDLIRRWRQGDRAPARCISCNECFKPGLKEGGIYCVQDRKQK